MIIDAKDKVLGRIATVASKHALRNETVHIINCNEAAVTGKKKVTFQKYKQRRSRGVPNKGPHFPKEPKRIVKRTVKGMLPTTKKRGREALSRIKCYNTKPNNVNGDSIDIEGADVKKSLAPYVTIKEISIHIGAQK